MPESDSRLLDFPCDFPLKVLGRAASDFDELVVGIVRKHIGDLDHEAVQCRPSRLGNYLSMTVTIRVDSRQQLDDLYRELSGHARILMVL